MATDELRSPLVLPRRTTTSAAAAGAALSMAAKLVLLIAGFGPLPSTCCSTSGHPRSSPPPDPVELTLLTAAHDKGAVCLDGSPPGYHLQAGSGAGSRSWLIHLEGGGWCDTVSSCASRRMTYLGSSKFMQRHINFTGILSNDPVQNPDFYSWNRVFVRYCDGASFAGDSQHEDDRHGNGMLFFRGRRIWEAVLDELTQKGLAHSEQASSFHLVRPNSISKQVEIVQVFAFLDELGSTEMTGSVAFQFQALLTGCSAGGLATLLHCDDFRARFPADVSVKCLPDAGFFLDARDLSGERYMRSVYNGVVHLQNVTGVLPKGCLLANKDPTECFFPAEIIKSIRTPTFILNSAYDSWQVQNVVAPDRSSPDESWRRCRADIRSCNSSQIQVLNEFRKGMVDDLKAAEDNMNCSWFIDSCFTHCRVWFDNSPWNQPVAPRLRNKTPTEAVGDWYFGRRQSQVVREIGCECPCNPTCNSQRRSCQLD